MTLAGAFVQPRDVIRVRGSDAETYLQGQIAQDLDEVEIGGSAWSLLLQPTGKVDSWFRIHRIAPGELAIDLDAGHGGTATARLERFKLRSDVRFELEPGWSLASLRGLDEAPVAGGELFANLDWPGFEGQDVLGRRLSLPDRVPVLAAADFEALRIASGWPRLGTELTADTIPADGGEALIASSVSFTKGCFTGQELVARIASRGGRGPHPVRVLVGASGAGLVAGATVELDGIAVGQVTSAAPARTGRSPLALATVLRRVEPGTEVTVGDAGAVVRVPPVPLP